MATVEKTENVRAVGRALEVLMAFSEADVELSAGELLKRVDLSRPTLYRLIYTLEEHGFLVSVGEPQRFRLGPSVARLAHAWKSTLDLDTLAEPVLRRIWEATQETVVMVVPQGNMRLHVAELPSPQPLNFRRGVGYTERLVLGATGRAILAFIDPTPTPALLRSHLQGTQVRLKDLEAKLGATRKHGYATSHNELITGAVAVAAPFFDRHAHVAGSVGVLGPEVRLNSARQKVIAKLLLEESAKLSRALGFTTDARRVGQVR
jgi:DNA-binding IclR family transcriptional regulator